MVKVKTRDTASLEILIRAIRGMDGVQRTETMIVLSTHTERTTLPLPSQAEGEVNERKTRSQLVDRAPQSPKEADHGGR